MSYDVCLVADITAEGTPEVDEVYWGNYTSNLWKMWKVADIDLRSYDGQSAREVGDRLIVGIHRLAGDPAHYSAMNPENGWGSYETGLVFLCEVLAACLMNPTATVRVT